jgi:phage gp29-like protein
VVFLPQNKEGKGFDVSMMETDSAANWQSFKERMSELNTEIAITLLGQNLTTEISGSSGSRAAVGGHDKVRIDYLKGDVQSLSAALKRQVVAPFVRYNFEDQADALGIPWQDLIPDATWVVEEEEDAKDAAAAISSIGTAVAPLQAAGADVKKLLEKHGIPVVDGPVPPVPAPDAAVPRPRNGEQPEQPLNPDAPPNPVSADARDQYQNSRRRQPALKDGARKGQVLADHVADQAREAAKESLAGLKEKLLRICLSSSDYQTKREQILELYRGRVTDRELRGIVEGAVTASELIGRVASHVDRK